MVGESEMAVKDFEGKSHEFKLVTAGGGYLFPPLLGRYWLDILNTKW